MSGRFVWHELMTTDPKAAIAFYSEVIGWKTEPFPGGEPGKEPYTMWLGSQGPIGGVLTLPEEAKKMGAPPHWMGNVEVADLDASVAKVTASGGKIYVPPMDIPNVGRVSVIADPQGASLALFQPTQKMAEHDVTKQGEVSWNELLTSDAAAAVKFYGDLLGWKVHEVVDMGPAGKYHLYGGEKVYGGIMTKTPDMPMPPTWVYYFQMDDLDAAVTRATGKGAKLIVGPIDVPGGTRIAQFMDPQNAHFALHAPGKK